MVTTREWSRDGGTWNNRSKSKSINNVFRQIHSFLKSFNNTISIHTAYIPSKSNLADAPSRGIYPPPELILPDIQLLTGLNRFIVDSTHPYTNSVFSTKTATPMHLQTALTTLSGILIPTNSPMIPNSTTTITTSNIVNDINPKSRFDTPPIPISTSQNRTPHRYQPDLTPLTPSISELRPHCTACDCLRLWKPTIS